MDYSEAYNRLEGLRRLRPNMGTDSTAALLGELGDPHTDLVTVQIAGSNGKGSTARILDRILREAGHTVGCYTSPDLNDRRERITVDGRKIPKRAVVDFVTRLWPFIIEQSADGNPPTFFEVYTALALWYFERESVDVAILEVGIGGRLDATSVVSPTAAAVTSVSLEHTDLLGETVEEIARDKAQDAPADRPLVTATTGAALATIAAETDVVRVAAKSADSDIDTVTDSDTDPNADTDTDTDEDSDGNATTDADRVRRTTRWRLAAAGVDPADRPRLGSRNRHAAARRAPSDQRGGRSRVGQTARGSVGRQNRSRHQQRSVARTVRSDGRRAADRARRRTQPECVRNGRTAARSA